MDIAICDDEKRIREQLAELVDIGEDCRIEQFSTGEELLAKKKHFDIIFLDIKMEGRNGVETASALRQHDEKAVIIFVTAIREYVFQAFDVRAFHYLLKPIEEQKFAEVFDAAKKEIDRQNRQKRKEEPVLLIKGRSRGVTIRQRDILYIESRSNKVVIRTAKDEIEAWHSLQKLEGELGNSFYRCHRSYLVNMAHITEYGSDRIDMDNGKRVYLAKDKYPEFVKAYLRYLDRGGAACV